MKFLKIETPRGRCLLPLIRVAEHRTDYYTRERFNKEWKDLSLEEYSKMARLENDFVMNDDFEGIDWIINNSNWEDWENKVHFIDNKVCVSEDDFWTDTDHFTIIDHVPILSAQTLVYVNVECPSCDNLQDVFENVRELMGYELSCENMNKKIECESCGEEFIIGSVNY